MYLTPCHDYIFELDTLLNMTPLDLKCCCCNVFDHVFLTFKINRGHFKFLNASYLYLIQKPYQPAQKII